MAYWLWFLRVELLASTALGSLHPAAGYGPRTAMLAPIPWPAVMSHDKPRRRRR